MDNAARDIGPRAKAMVRLLYRRAALIERIETIEVQYWKLMHHPVERNDAAVQLEWLELMEIEKLLPNVARTV